MTWGLPGGKANQNESLLETIERECTEELGAMPEYIRLVPLEKFTSQDENFCYHTFFCTVGEEFKPVLNCEHLGYAWIGNNVYPKPMHPGLWATVNFDVIKEKINLIQDQH